MQLFNFFHLYLSYFISPNPFIVYWPRLKISSSLIGPLQKRTVEQTEPKVIIIAEQNHILSASQFSVLMILLWLLSITESITESLKIIFKKIPHSVVVSLWPLGQTQKLWLHLCFIEAEKKLSSLRVIYLRTISAQQPSKASWTVAAYSMILNNRSGWVILANISILLVSIHFSIHCLVVD